MSQLSLFKLIRLEVFFLGRFCQQFSSWVICIQARTYLDDLERFESEETEEEETENGLRTKSQIIRKAVLLLIMGTIITAVFADPLVDAVTAFSTSSQIPSFFIFLSLSIARCVSSFSILLSIVAPMGIIAWTISFLHTS